MTVKTIFILVCIIAALYFFICTVKKEGMEDMSSPRCPDTLVQRGSRLFLYNSRLAEVPGVNPIAFNNLEEYVEFLEWQKSQGISCPVLYLQEVEDASGKVTCKVRPCVTEPQGGLPPTNATLDAKTTKFSTDSSSKIGDTGSSKVTGAMLPGELPNVDPASLAINPVDRYSNLERMNLLDATYDDPPFNRGGYPAHDPSSFYQGVHTPLDELDVKQEATKRSPNPMDPNWGGKSHTSSLVQGGHYKENEVYTY